MNKLQHRLIALFSIAAMLGACSQLTAKKDPIAVTQSKAESFRFTYQIKIPTIPPGAKSIEIIVPSPPSDDKQTISHFQVISNLNDSQYVDPEYHNNILLFNSGKDIPAAIDISLSFSATRKRRAPVDSLEDTEFKISKFEDFPDSLKKYLLPNSLVPIDGQIQAEADSVLRGIVSPLEKARALYNHLFGTMKYDKSGTGWGNGDALYACDVRSGNCTDIHSLFIGMARSQGIPARFRIGFPLPKELLTERTKISGYHCWAEFYLADGGWIPVDISEAIKHPAEKEFYFGRLDSHRIGFTVGRDIVAPTLSGEREFNYLIYPQVFIDGVKYDEVVHKFTASQS